MAEHAHSCCTLLARKDTFYRDGKWFTWIDYAKFQELIEKVRKGGREGGREGGDALALCNNFLLG